MLFNSYIFLLFFFAVYALYLVNRKSLSKQNLLLLIASYVFYGTWDWRFLFLIIASTLVDYVIGLQLYKTPRNTTSARRKRKQLLSISVVANLGILGFFKYFNFFADNLEQILNLFGLNPDPVTLNIILPVGISFYTFQTMSYTIDIYRGTLKPTSNLLNFALFVAFFPQLVAGPIERAANLLPQVERPRKIRVPDVNAGLFLILWGYAKKVVIADQCGILANQVFDHYTDYQGLAVLLGGIAFAIQIYGDFSGYSDIARGISKLMGIDLMVNFKLPYFAETPSDFWKRWHISLSSWLRDYLYIPLGGNKKGSIRTYCNLFIAMLLGGLWHGAAWNFILWGIFHGLILIIYRIAHIQITSSDSRIKHLTRWFIMSCLTLLGWFIFRSDSIHQFISMITSISLQWSPSCMRMTVRLIFFCTPLLGIQLWQSKTGNLLAPISKSVLVTSLLYASMLFYIVVFSVRESHQFIYFQF